MHTNRTNMMNDNYPIAHKRVRKSGAGSEEFPSEDWNWGSPDWMLEEERWSRGGVFWYLGSWGRRRRKPPRHLLREWKRKCRMEDEEVVASAGMWAQKEKRGVERGRDRRDSWPQPKATYRIVWMREIRTWILPWLLDAGRFPSAIVAAGTKLTNSEDKKTVPLLFCLFVLETHI